METCSRPHTQTSRAYAFEMWMQAPMPMVTLFKTLDVSHLVRLSRRKRSSSICLCAGASAAPQTTSRSSHAARRRQTYALRHDRRKHYRRQPTGRGQLVRHPFSDDLRRFNDDYMHLTRQVAETCANHDLAESMVIGTSALTQCEIDGAVGMYSGIFNNPFLIWGEIPPPPTFSGQRSVSLSSSTTQMDGAHAARFLDALQREITALKV